MISIAAYQAAFEQYDYSFASAIAMIMGVVQLGFVVVDAAPCAASSIAAPASCGKG